MTRDLTHARAADKAEPRPLTRAEASALASDRPAWRLGHAGIEPIHH